VADQRETFLGDGLYVALENGMVRLFAPHPDGVVHEVFLEAEVLENFIDWLKDRELLS
jgi:hypothetical protein